MLSVDFYTHLLLIVSQAKQSKQLLTKEICLLSEETKYIFLQRKEEKCNLFIYLMNPGNSKIIIMKKQKKNSSTLPLRCGLKVKFKTRGECP